MELSVQETAEALRAGAIRVIDVRGEDEHQFARIEGSNLISQELMEEILTSWDKHTAIVLYCHDGVRSLGAAQFLSQKGFTNVKSMRGGIDAWSVEIDPQVPRY